MSPPVIQLPGSFKTCSVRRHKPAKVSINGSSALRGSSTRTCLLPKLPTCLKVALQTAVDWCRDRK